MYEKAASIELLHRSLW